jgi:hypothetical protein
MKAAFVLMSILGCDNSGIHCQPVATLPHQWPTIAACDAASDKMLATYKNVRYPNLVAVCQTAGTTALKDSEDEALEQSTDMASRALPDAGKDEKPGLAGRAIALVKRAIPSKSGIRSTLIIPVHIVTDTYSWVVKKVAE